MKIIYIFFLLSTVYTQTELIPDDITIMDLNENTHNLIHFNYYDYGNLFINLKYYDDIMAKNTEIHLKSPSGEIYNLRVSGEEESGFTYEGNLSNYIFNYTDQLNFHFMLPYEDFEMGEWTINEIKIVDFSNNTLILFGESFSENNLNINVNFLYDESSIIIDNTPPQTPSCITVSDGNCCGGTEQSCIDLNEQENLVINYIDGYASLKTSIWGIEDNHIIYDWFDVNTFGIPAIKDFELIFTDQNNQIFNLKVDGSNSTTNLTGNLSPYFYYGMVYYGLNYQVELYSIIPYNLFGNNILEFSNFIITDFSGNSLQLSQQDLSNLGFRTQIEFISNQSCVDTDNGSTDSWGLNCTNYLPDDYFCGLDDDDDFIAEEMCCACGGGQLNNNQDNVPPSFYYPDGSLIDVYTFFIDDDGNELENDGTTVFINHDSILYFGVWAEIIDNSPQNVIPQFGFILESPSGQEFSFNIEGSSESFSTIGGSLIDYNWFAIFNNGSFVAEFLLPPNHFELGTWIIKRLYSTDLSGNTAFLENEELESLNIINKLEFQSSNSLTHDFIENFTLLNWNWGIGDNIIIQQTALENLSTDDVIYLIDNNASLSSDCLDLLSGPAILDYQNILNTDNEFSLYANPSANYCNESNYNIPGYNIGNEMKFLLYDQSIDEYINLEPNYSSGNGIYGASFDDTLTFKYYDASANMVYDLEESLVFIPDMIEGDAINPSAFTIDYSTQTPGAPNWNFDFHYYEFNGSITSAVYDYGELLSDEGDIIAAFVNSECRGSIEASVTPDPIFEDVVFHLMVYANPTITRISSFEIINDRHSRDLTDYTNLESETNYKYNVYKNDILLEASYEENFIIDYDLDDGESCYEVYLIDNYDNSEFLTTDPFCLYYEPITTGCSLLGDSTGDGLLNVLDIVNMVSYIMGNSTMDENALICSDVNQDNNINVLDVVASVAIIMGN